MEKHLHFPGQDPALGVNLVEAAKVLQWEIDLAEDDPLKQQELITQALAIFETGDELCGGHRVILHALEAYVLNPVGGTYALDRPEQRLGELRVEADFNGIAHFEAIGRLVLNSLCLDVGNVKLLKDFGPDAGKESGRIAPSLVIPVQSVDTVLAA